MKIYVFISSTTEDLKDSRPLAIDVVKSFDQTEVLAMEQINSDHRPQVVVCREMVEKSSHYVGIFAFRRGWVPPENNKEGKSITELEYDWALELGKRLYVLIPQMGSSISIQLRNSAKGQHQDELKAQENFRKRVMNQGWCVAFDSHETMERRLREKVAEWIDSRGMSLLDQSSKLEQKPTKSSNQNTNNVFINTIKIGRILHTSQFEFAMKLIRQRRGYPGACFLIAGSSGYGHDQLIVDIADSFPSQSAIARFRCSATLEINQTPEMLFQSIAEWILGSNQPLVSTANSLASLMKNTKLKYSDVVIKLDDINKFQGGLIGFVNEFWQPLIFALGQAEIGRLVILLKITDESLDSYEDILHEPTLGIIDVFRVIKLPQLEIFTQEEIEAFLEKAFPHWSDSEITAKAARVIAETQGIPERVYSNLG